VHFSESILILGGLGGAFSDYLDPSLDWAEDAPGHTKHQVNVTVALLWPCIARDGRRAASGGWQSHRWGK